MNMKIMQKKTSPFISSCSAVILCIPFISLCSCTSPEIRFSQQAEQYHFEKKIVGGTLFRHRIYIKPSVNHAILHIYLDGDGSAWVNHRWISSNPTPRNHLLLRLMRQDKNTSLYIGRPCYFGLSQSPQCTSKLWTSHRYSPTVIDSMVVVIDKMIKHYQARHIILIGYSGGGALAVLIAEKLPNIKGIITIAANLDIKAWADDHGYSPLTGSLNPINQQPLAKNIFQLHLAGRKDNNIKIKHIKSYAQKQYLTQVRVFDDYDHHCCWEKIWPSILKSINTNIKI